MEIHFVPGKIVLGSRAQVRMSRHLYAKDHHPTRCGVPCWMVEDGRVLLSRMKQ